MYINSVYQKQALTIKRNMKSVTPNEKTSKIDLFLTPVTLTLGQGQTPTMPGYYFFQDASTIAISSRSDFGKVVKK